METKERKKHRQTDRKTGRQSDRKTDRNKVRQTQTHINIRNQQLGIPGKPIAHPFPSANVEGMDAS